MVDSTKFEPESLDQLYTQLKQATAKQQHAIVVDLSNKIMTQVD
jgi:hypothetical protein